jgi:hypothetical protein
MPFVLDPRPLEEATSPHAGALATSQVFRSLGLPEIIEANLQLRQRQRGVTESQTVETLNLLQTIGGDCPEDVRLLSGDSCLERGLDWLKDAQRAQEPGGAIEFAVSAVTSEALAAALKRVEERGWQTFGKEDGTLRQWAEVDFVPGDKPEHKDRRLLRYVGLRLLKPQGLLFADGSDRHYHAVVTNRKLEGGAVAGLASGEGGHGGACP